MYTVPLLHLWLVIIAYPQAFHNTMGGCGHTPWEFWMFDDFRLTFCVQACVCGSGITKV